MLTSGLRVDGVFPSFYFFTYVMISSLVHGAALNFFRIAQVATVHPGGELVDVTFDNGEKAERVPTYDVEAVVLAAQ